MTGKSVVPGRGRKPKPSKRKMLAGNPGKRAVNQNEPQFTAITKADPPEWFDEISRTMWETVIDELCSQQLLHVTDLHNVVVFCSAYRNWQTAQQEVMKMGITVKDEKGTKKNPALTAANEAIRQMVTVGSLLGLDPSSRQRLCGGGLQKSDNPFKNL
ncbi:phage terminase small subunit P27 family [Hafnia paralvei]